MAAFTDRVLASLRRSWDLSTGVYGPLPHAFGFEETEAEVADLLADLGIRANIHLVNVSDDADAQRLKFLGSPTLRVNGHDVDPTADTRNHYALQCRLYRTEAGLAGTPPDEWVKRALVQPGP